MTPGKEYPQPGRAAAGQTELAAYTRSFTAQPELVRDTLISLADRIRPHVPADLLSRTELVLAEFLNNIAEHGRSDDIAPRPLVHLSVVALVDGVTCSVSDDGGHLPQVCLTSQPPEPETFPEGGFGWFLIGHLTQSLAYIREGEHNFIAFTIPLEAPIPS
ncbi:MAG: ATP-binding protein [Paracoccus sp. (in: a-proteobacteria)]